MNIFNTTRIQDDCCVELIEKERILSAGDCLRGIVVQWLEHWRLRPDVLGLIPGGTTFFPDLCCFKGLQTVYNCVLISCVALRSSDIAPSIGPVCSYA